jgi:predicted O-methyltransferase YrrM
VLRKLEFSQFDFIYVDGHHGQVEVMEDAVLSFRLARRGSIICSDDYLWDDPRFNKDGTPKLSLDAFLKIYEKKIAVLELGNQVWIRKMTD